MEQRKNRLRWAFAGALATSVVMVGVTQLVGASAAARDSATAVVAATEPPDGPIPVSGVARDQVTPAELEKARTAGAAGLTGTNVDGATGPEYLSFELAEPKPGEAGATAPRRVSVYFYDYTANTLLKRVVNVGSGSVEETFTAKQIQPPPSDRESAKALQLLLASDLGAEFKSRFQTTARRAFTSAAQLQATAAAYVARPADSGADHCGAERCVQLFAKLPDGSFVDVSDIVVNLSSRTVTRLS